MSSSLLELQRLQAAPPPAPPAAPAPPPPVRGGGLAVQVPGVVPAIRERVPELRWHASALMLLGWRARHAEGRLRPGIPGRFLPRVDEARPIADREKAAFLAGCGLLAELASTAIPVRWAALLREYGSLWVTTEHWDGSASGIFSRVVTGLRGGPTPDATQLDVIDPATGGTATMTLAALGAAALAQSPRSRVEVIHFPRDVHMAIVRSAQGARSLAIAAALDGRGDPGDGEPLHPELAPRGVVNAREMGLAIAAAAPPPMGAADARWADDAVNPDLRHVAAAGVSVEFGIDEASLANAVFLNHFALPAAHRRVVFALRGCRLHGAPGWTRQLAVEEDLPNHFDNCCLIGVWNRDDHRVIAFHASTVPNWVYMEKYRQGTDKANMLVTGLHSFRVGTHRPGTDGAVPGCLLQDEPRVVLRTRDDLTYTVTDFWDHGWQGDNVHPARTSIHAPPSTTPDFSSAGCQTVPGDYANGRFTGDWAAFREALGFDNAHPSANDGTSVSYILLGAREFRVAGGASQPAMSRLRFGSSGPAVIALQSALRKLPGNGRLATDGSMGPQTVAALIAWQQARDNGAADGIVTPAIARALGFTI
ncbi:MAG TPA: peptidoglycan-binding protein [Gemmatimonadaceae bacterium]